MRKPDVKPRREWGGPLPTESEMDRAPKEWRRWARWRQQDVTETCDGWTWWERPEAKETRR